MSVQDINTPENIKEEVARSPKMILAEIESAKFEIKSLFRQYRGAVKSASAVGKAYEKASMRSAERPNSRNSVKLARAESELESAMSQVRMQKGKIKDAIQDVVDKYDSISQDYSSEGHRFKAWRYRRQGERFLNTELERLDELSSPVAVYSSFRELENKATRPQSRGASGYNEQNRDGASPGMPRPSYPPQAPFYFVPAYVDPQKMNKPTQDTSSIKEEIKSAINEAIAPIMEKIDEKINTAVAAILVSSVNAVDTSGVRESGLSVEEINKLVNDMNTILTSLRELVSGAEGITAKSKEISELQSEVIEMQRTLARDVQGVQVKQRLVNDGQTEIAEKQEIVLQHQKLLLEKQGEISDEQQAAISGVDAINEAQIALSQSIKESIQTQKGIIQANAKNSDAQRELIERQTEIAEEQKSMLHRQKILSKAVKNSAKTNEN